jgi:hypothetical protein
LFTKKNPIGTKKSIFPAPPLCTFTHKYIIDNCNTNYIKDKSNEATSFSCSKRFEKVEK